MSVTTATPALAFRVGALALPSAAPTAIAAASATTPTASTQRETLTYPSSFVVSPIGRILARIFDDPEVERLVRGGVRVVLALVHEDAARLRALVAGDDPAALEHVDQP